MSTHFVKKHLLSLLLTGLFCTNNFAAEINYSIIVDAGGSGSRVHLFQHNDDKNLPDIKDIFSKKNNLPLAAFANHPENAGESLKPLLDDVTKKIHDDKITEVIPIHVLGTAGMRLLTSEEQKAIYSSVKKYIGDHYSDTLTTMEIHTLSGKMEGIYDWLDVNYLAKNFQNKAPTAGSLDMGSASTQIAFATDKLTKSIDQMAVKINGVEYIVFSKSFLGLGLDQVRESMKMDALAATCYPKNAPFKGSQTGQFNLVNCRSIYQQIIESYRVADQIIPVYKVPTFIAFSGAYYTYHFFGADPNPPNQETLEQNVMNPVCGNPWEVLKAAFPYEDEAFLVNYCANGIYLTDLFYSAYQIQSKQLKVLNKINDQGIDWTLGAMMYMLIAKD